MLKKIIRFYLPIAALSVSIGALQSCGNNGEKESNPKDSVEVHNDAKFDKLGEKDAQALVDAYTAGMIEIKMADTAKTYATTKEGKSLAKMLAQAHSSLNSQIKTLADKKQITLPPGISTDQQDKINKMRNERRIDFDKEYAEEMVDKHKDAISLYEKCAKECTDQDIRDWFTSAIPELRKHLDMAMSSEEKLKDIKK